MKRTIDETPSEEIATRIITVERTRGVQVTVVPNSPPPQIVDTVNPRDIGGVEHILDVPTHPGEESITDTLVLIPEWTPLVKNSRGRAT